MARVVETYTERIIDLKRDRRFRYVQIFKDHGEMAGSLIFHPHSHVLATPILPQQLALEIANSKSHYLQKERCLLCDVVSQEGRQEKRIVALTDHFLVLCPFASRVAFEVWIIPLMHHPAFESIIDGAMKKDFIGVFLETMRRVEKVASSYSVVIHSSPQWGDRWVCRRGLVGGRLLSLAHRDPSEGRQFRKFQAGRPILTRSLLPLRKRPFYEDGKALGEVP